MTPEIGRSKFVGICRMNRRIFYIGGAVSLAVGLLVAVFTVSAEAFSDSQAVLQINPVILGQRPTANSHTTPLTATIAVTFDQPMDPAAVHTKTFVIQAMQTGLLTGMYGVDGDLISLSPTLPFWPGELVQVSTTTGTLSLGGQGPVSPTVWQFWAAVSGGNGIFTDSGQLLGTNRSMAVALGDLDKDGDLDAVVGNGPIFSSSRDKIWFNDGTGIFTDTGQLLGNYVTLDVTLGDIDNDGDLDVFAGTDGRNEIYINDGQGFFSNSGQQLGNSPSYGVALADMDGDGDLDALAAHYSENSLWLNDGSGVFSLGQNFESESSFDIAIGDIDNDGDLDVYSANFYVGDTIWLNDGTGLLTSTGHGFSGSGVHSVALGDADGDGDLDAAVANEIFGNMLWLNDGSGFFVDSGQGLGNERTWDIALVDLDGDGDLDIHTANFDHIHGDENRIFVNDSTGLFTDSGQLLGKSATTKVAFGDVDEDGDLDIFEANFILPKGNRVWINQNYIANLAAENDSPTAIGAATILTAVLGVGHASYAWDFGDGSSGSGRVVSYVYPAVGEYTAVVTASHGAEILTATTVVVIAEGISGLTADNDSPTPLGNLTYLTATITHGENVSFSWDFGDASSGVGAAVTHLYQAVGVYSVVVTASNPVDMVTATTTVIVDEGISGLIAINDSPTLLGEATNLTATIAAGSNVNYVWDLGDGTGSSGSQAAHVYPAAGVYTAVVAASNSINTVTATTQVLVVEAIAGLAVVSNSPVAPGETMILTATVTAGSDVVYTWDFGDGNMGSGAVVNHVYVEAGGYRVVVTATNEVSSMSVQTSVSVRASGYYIFMPVVVKGVVNSPQLPVLWKPLFDDSS
jgi:hypothetical protein